MTDARAVLSTVLYCLWWPVTKILLAIGIILSPFWSVAQFILLPVTYLVQGLLAVILFPFRLHILERIETIYIWLGVASLIGCITGAVLFLLFKFLSSALDIDGAAGANSRPKGKTIKEFRTARRMKKEPPSESSSGPTVIEAAAARRRGISSQAILEEESEY
ncbi:hypothetical protein N0V90_001624 [Kalmusia sp. IMI 367209]|nr:hypothetical protein N0V90_001624 [Kalmusia sp. IMI 367209]